MFNEVVVLALDKRYKKLEKDLTDKARKVLLFLKQRGVSLEIYLVSGAAIGKLNRQHRGEDEPTNVLAYEPPKNFPVAGSRPLGEIYLSPSHIKKRGEDIVSLLTHGILHLTGFNHTKVSDRMTMEKMEEAIFRWLNR
jgi:rRNA maturation RNase YbeY